MYGTITNYKVLELDWIRTPVDILHFQALWKIFPCLSGS